MSWSRCLDVGGRFTSTDGLSDRALYVSQYVVTTYHLAARQVAILCIDERCRARTLLNWCVCLGKRVDLSSDTLTQGHRLCMFWSRDWKQKTKIKPWELPEHQPNWENATESHARTENGSEGESGWLFACMISQSFVVFSTCLTLSSKVQDPELKPDTRMDNALPTGLISCNWKKKHAQQRDE